MSITASAAGGCARVESPSARSQHATRVPGLRRGRSGMGRGSMCGDDTLPGACSARRGDRVGGLEPTEDITAEHRAREASAVCSTLDSSAGAPIVRGAHAGPQAVIVRTVSRGDSAADRCRDRRAEAPGAAVAGLRGIRRPAPAPRVRLPQLPRGAGVRARGRTAGRARGPSSGPPRRLGQGGGRDLDPQDQGPPHQRLHPRGQDRRDLRGPARRDDVTSQSIQINRAPVLTLWAAVVAERLGYDAEEALTLGRAGAGLNARPKARALGITGTTARSKRGSSSTPRPPKARAPLEVELLGRVVPVVKTPDGVRSAESGKPADPAAVRRYLEGKFGEALPAARRALVALGKASPPETLAARG